MLTQLRIEKVKSMSICINIIIYIGTWRISYLSPFGPWMPGSPWIPGNPGTPAFPFGPSGPMLPVYKVYLNQMI